MMSSEDDEDVGIAPLLVCAKPAPFGPLQLRDIEHGGLLARLARVEWLTTLAYLYGNDVCSTALASRWCYCRLRSVDEREARGLWRFLLRRDFSPSPPHVQLLQQQPPCTVAHLMRAITAAEAEHFRADGSAASPPLGKCLCSPGAIAPPLVARAEPLRCERCGAWRASAARIDRNRRWLNERLDFAASRPPTERDVALCNELVGSLWVCCALAREARGPALGARTASAAPLGAALRSRASTQGSIDGDDAHAQEMAVFDVEAARSSELTATLAPTEPLCRAYSDLTAVYSIYQRASARQRAKMSARAHRGRARYGVCCIPVHCGSTALPFALFPLGALAWLLWGAVVVPPTLRFARRGEIDVPRLLGSGGLPNAVLSSATTALLLLPAVATLLCALALVCVAAPIRWLCNTPRDSRARRVCVRLCGDHSDWYDASELIFVDSPAAKRAAALRASSSLLDRPTHIAFQSVVILHARSSRARQADHFWRSDLMPSALFPLPQVSYAIHRYISCESC